VTKTVLITGASRGIGAACARLFAENRYRVAINYCRSAERAKALATSLCAEGYMAEIFYADVSKQAEVEAMFDSVKKTFGKIDVLVNNAGVAKTALFTDFTAEEFQKLMEVNVNGAFYCAQCAVKDMLSRHTGRIINLSSIWGITGASCEVAYSASKAAIIGMTKALAKELGPSGITVNCVAPGVIDTEMNANLTVADMDVLREETPLERIGTPEDVANAVLYLAGDGASFITGQVLSPNGGIVI